MMLTSITKEFLYEVHSYIKENKKQAEERIADNEVFPIEIIDFYHYILMGDDRTFSDDSPSDGKLAWNMAAEKLYDKKEMRDLKEYYENSVCRFEMETWKIINIMNSYGFFDGEKAKRKDRVNQAKDEFAYNFRKENMVLYETDNVKYLDELVDAWLEIADFI